jgi:hypothetical protein
MIGYVGVKRKKVLIQKKKKCKEKKNKTSIEDNIKLLDPVGSNQWNHSPLDNIEVCQDAENLDDIDEDYRFLPEHPQYLTYKIICKAENPYIVPNFVGGTLPHCDQGDREYYCSTMLTLFKP